MSASCKNLAVSSSFTATQAVRIGVLALVLTAAIAAGIAAAPTVSAAGVCPTGADSCLIVNTNADVNVRDAKLSLREAMLVDTGGLSYSSLTTAERGQALLNTQNAMAPDGIRYIYFDPTVFCAGCPTSVIVLSPPGFGGPSVRADGANTDVAEGTMDTPPGFGGPSSLPPGFGGPSSGGTMGADTEGFGLLAQAAEMMTPPGFGGPSPSCCRAQAGGGLSIAVGEVAAAVTLDGSLLDANTTGMNIARNGAWLKGLRFERFAGSALSMPASVQPNVLLGTNNDGTLDGSEGVLFSGNGTNILILE